MNPKARPMVWLILLAVLALVANSSGAAPLNGSCAPGASYDPACDADHDGDVDILDIQLTAGHWNQSGTYVSDNTHDHLGQTWTGSNNSLKLTGAFAGSDGTALMLSNSAGSGLGVTSAAATGIYVDSAGFEGVSVFSAGYNGVYVNSAGSNGVLVNWAGSNGVYVGSAGAHGVYAQSTNGTYNGVYGINSGGGNGVRGDSNGAVTSGVYGQNSGGGIGVAGRVTNGGRAIYADGGAGWAGWFDGSVNINGICTGCLQASFAVNAGIRSLQPGDVVAVRGGTPTDFDNAPVLWEVLPVQPGQAAVGVVTGHATPVAAPDHPPAETGHHLLPDQGAAAPGEYVVVVYGGPVKVRLASEANSIAAGTRVTAAADGAVRPLQTRIVDGMVVAEGAPVLGIALGEASDGLVWVLVNPQ